MKTYILKTEDDGFYLIGPFEPGPAAGEYGRGMQHQEWGDDPRWQTVDLADPNAPVRVVAP